MPRAVSGVPGLSLCRAERLCWLRALRGAGEARVVRLGAEPARLAELYWLSLVLTASAWLRDLRVSLAGSRGPARGDRLNCRGSRCYVDRHHHAE